MSRYAIIAVLLGVSFGLVACGHLNHDRGAGLYTEKRYFEAEYYLQRALRTDPGDANAKLLLALVYLKTYRERHATPLLHELAQTESNALVDGNALPEYANMPISTAAKHSCTGTPAHPEGRKTSPAGQSHCFCRGLTPQPEPLSSLPPLLG